MITHEHYTGMGSKSVLPSWKNWLSSDKVENVQIVQPSNFSLRAIPLHICIRRNYKNIHRILFIIANNWDQPKYSLTRK